MSATIARVVRLKAISTMEPEASQERIIEWTTCSYNTIGGDAAYLPDMLL